MRVNNQTSDPVDWEQNGGSPQPYTAGSASRAASTNQEGQLTAHAATGDFPPDGLPPWEVHFTSIDIKPQKSAKSPQFTDPKATVTLNDNWTVTVS